MDIIMLILAITCTLLGVLIGDCAKCMRSATVLQKLLAIFGGAALLGLGIFLFAGCFGML